MSRAAPPHPRTQIEYLTGQVTNPRDNDLLKSLIKLTKKIPHIVKESYIPVCEEWLQRIFKEIVQLKHDVDSMSRDTMDGNQK